MYIHATRQVRIRKILRLVSFLRPNKSSNRRLFSGRLSCSLLSFVSLLKPLHHLFFSWRGRNKHNRRLSQHSKIIGVESFLDVFDTVTLFLLFFSCLQPFKLFQRRGTFSHVDNRAAITGTCVVWIWSTQSGTPFQSHSYFCLELECFEKHPAMLVPPSSVLALAATRRSKSPGSIFHFINIIQSQIL